MNILRIEATEETPAVMLDADQNIFQISGRSICLDAFGFYQPIINWLNEYNQNPNPSTAFEFELEYCNTISAQVILEMVFILEKLPHIEIKGLEMESFLDFTFAEN